MEELEVQIRVELRSGRKFPLLLACTRSATCNDIIETIKDCTIELDMSASNSQWKLIEKWQGLEHKLSGRSNFCSTLISWSKDSTVYFIAREKNKKKKRTKNNKKAPNVKKSSQVKAHDDTNITTDKAVNLKRKELQEIKREVSRLRLVVIRNSSDVNSSQSDPIRLGLQIIATMADKLDTLMNNKTQLTSEVFDMNHEATRLTEHLTVLRRTSQTASDSLTQFKEVREKKKEERELEKKERLEYLNEAISSSQVELDKRQRMSELQDSKITLLQDEIASLNITLNQREKEVEKMKNWVDQRASESTKEAVLPTKSGLFHVPEPSIKREREGGDSFKRRFMNINIKTKQQVEEEARVFREALSSNTVLSPLESPDGPGLNEDSSSKNPLAISQTAVQRKNSSSKEDKKEKKGILKTSDQKKKRVVPSKSVNFDSTSLLLNAAGEGDIELVKECIKELGDCRMVVSAKGATCLHNAVCSGNLNAVQYFIDMGCDVNAQDCEGWTPLHCAAGFTHLPAIHLLIQNGASLYLRTSDDQLSVDLVHEMATASDEGTDNGGTGCDIDAQNCYDYLRDCSTSLGNTNQKRTYGLFNYIATSNDELSFITGEELVIVQRDNADESWWEAENAHGTRGYVPSSFLGLYPRKQTVL